MPGSSPEPTPIEGDPSPPAGQADVSTTEASSSSETDKGAPDLLASVKEALESKSQEQSPSSERDPADPQVSTPKVEAEAKPEGQDELGELTDVELKRYGPKTQKRIQQLLGQREEATKRVEALEPDAGKYRQISDFAKKNNLDDSEIDGTLEIAALVKTDPFKALDRLTPIYSALLAATGHVLPQELQERVRQGYLTEEDARARVQAENRALLLEQRTEAQNEARVQEQQRERVHAHVDAVSSVATEWETARKRTDPDWSSKQARIGELVELRVLKTGYPKTQKDVVSMLDDIHKRVTDEIVQFRPKPRSITPVVGAASSRATAEPTTPLEAARQALAASA